MERSAAGLGPRCFLGTGPIGTRSPSTLGLRARPIRLALDDDVIGGIHEAIDGALGGIDSGYNAAVILPSNTSRLRIAAILVILLATGEARADDPAPSSPAAAPAAPIPEDDRLGRFLEVEASAGRKGRIVSAVVDTVVLAATVPPGVILVTKQDPALEMVGLAVLVQGGWAVIALPFTLQPMTLETLRDHYEERKARGEPEAERTAQTEREWQKTVEDARRASTSRGVLALTLGGTEFAWGMTLLLVNDSVLGDDRREQTFWGSLFVGISLPVIAGGLWAVLGSPEIERDWSLYQAGKPRSANASLHPLLSAVPIRGGAAGALQLVF
jgi:hypothetical protein